MSEVVNFLIQSGQVEIGKLLIATGASINQLDWWDFTSLCVAALFNILDRYGLTSLYYACREGYL